MSVIARTWVTGELATAAKMNTIRDDLVALDAEAGPVSIQRGTIVWAGAVTQADASITAVLSTAGAELAMLGESLDSGSSDPLVTLNHASRISMPNNTTVRANRERHSDGNLNPVSGQTAFQVTEWAL